jgi:iron complex transport system substrate-binding protein
VGRLAAVAVLRQSRRMSSILMVLALAVGVTDKAATPPRIVSLSPHITELLFAAGAGSAVVGTVGYSDFPPAARVVPRIGDAVAVDVERISALQPNLVIYWRSGTPARTRTALTRVGLTLRGSEQRHIDDIATSLLEFGGYAPLPGVAIAAAKEFRSQVAERRRRYAGARRLAVFYQVWDTPVYTLSGEHIANEVLQLCGGRNVFADLAGLAPVVDIEAVIARDPDVILIGAEGAEAERQMRVWQQLTSVRAVKQRRIYSVDPSLLNRMTPRIVAGIDAVCDALARARLERNSQ